MRFFEDETKGFRIDPKIVVSIPISLIAVSWVIDIFLATVKRQWKNQPDDVSNIHNRFSFTLINPSSHYFSLVASLVIGAVITLTTYFAYLPELDFETSLV